MPVPSARRLRRPPCRRCCPCRPPSFRRQPHSAVLPPRRYIEACESGSIFQGLLRSDLGIYATTAANERESSWGTYCPGMVPAPPAGFDTCLGDLYSVAWLEDSDCSDLNAESLKKQYQQVRLRASQNWTYAQGSHVQRFGALAIDEEPVAEYLGEGNTGAQYLGEGSTGMRSTKAQAAARAGWHSYLGEGNTAVPGQYLGMGSTTVPGHGAPSTAQLSPPRRRPCAEHRCERAAGGYCVLQPGPDMDGGSNAAGADDWRGPLGAVPQRDADLMPLISRYATAATAEAKVVALRALRAAQAARAGVDEAVRAAVASLVAPLAGGGLLQRLEVRLTAAIGVAASAHRTARRWRHCWVRVPLPRAPLRRRWRPPGSRHWLHTWWAARRARWR